MTSSLRQINTNTDAGTLVLTLPHSGGVTSLQVLAVPTGPGSGSPRVIVVADP